MWDDISQKLVRRNFLVEISPSEIDGHPTTKPRARSPKIVQLTSPSWNRKLIPGNFQIEIEMTRLGKLILGNFSVEWHVFDPHCSFSTVGSFKSLGPPWLEMRGVRACQSLLGGRSADLTSVPGIPARLQLASNENNVWPPPPPPY